MGVGERDAGTSNFAEPDESYHGIIHTRSCAVAPLVMKVRIELARKRLCWEVPSVGCLCVVEFRTGGCRWRGLHSLALLGFLLVWKVLAIFLSTLSKC